MLKTEMKFRRELVDYIGDLSFRIQRVEGEAVSVAIWHCPVQRGQDRGVA